MKYAILRSGSRQLRAEEGEVLAVDRMQKETGEEVEFSAVFLRTVKIYRWESLFWMMCQCRGRCWSMYAVRK